MSRRASNVVALPSKPIARAVGTPGTAAILELGAFHQVAEQLVTAYTRELELRSAFERARYERKALIRRLVRLSDPRAGRCDRP
jgi:hypothetical protein